MWYWYNWFGGGGGGTALGETDGKETAVCQFANISRTASMDASWELHMMLGISLTCVILSSAAMWGCVRYSCKYYAVSIISSDFLFLSIAWMQR